MEGRYFMNYNNMLFRMKDNIPEFNTTKEALQFGQDNKGNLSLINYMGELRQRLQAKAQYLFNNGKEAEALYLLSGQVQFIKESLEVMKG